MLNTVIHISRKTNNSMEQTHSICKGINDGIGSKRIVVVGSGGRLGSSLANFLERNHIVTRFDRSQLDLTSAESIIRALEGIDYEILILTGALTAVDYCENHVSEAYAVNSSGPRLVAEISATKKAHVTYISTDMVFDGLKEMPYTEDDTPDPISIYGASKLEGESGVMSASKDNLVARVSWVFGPGRPAFPDWVIDKACSEYSVILPGDKIGCPTFSLDLIDWLSVLLFNNCTGPASGIFHLCNSSPCSWREWGYYCIDTARKAGLPVLARHIHGVSVHSVPAFLAKRPVNSAMDTAKFSKLTGIRPRDWREALRDYVIQNPSFNKYLSSHQGSKPSVA